MRFSTLTVFALAAVLMVVNAEDAAPAEDAAAEPAEDAAPPPPSEVPPPDDPVECTVDKLYVKPSFDVKAFMGLWYVSSDTGLYPFQRTLDVLFYAVQDLKHFFELQPDGNVKVITSVRSLFGCSTQVGVLAPTDAISAAKMSSSYPGSWVPALKNPSPFWVVGTDYTSWALIYSCRKVTSDGVCDPKHTVSWTLQRNTEELPEATRNVIHEHADAHCVEYNDFKPMPRSKVCPDINPEEYPDAIKPKAEL